MIAAVDLGGDSHIIVAGYQDMLKKLLADKNETEFIYQIIYGVMLNARIHQKNGTD